MNMSGYKGLDTKCLSDMQDPVRISRTFHPGIPEHRVPSARVTVMQETPCLGQITDVLSAELADLQLHPKVLALSIVPFETQCGV